MNAAQNYSWLDRMFHRVAFSSRAVQLTAADVEKSLFGRRFGAVAVDRPVFITSLPRAGTTLLLEILARIPAFATYTYRDMPFVMAPLLWESLSRGFRKPADLKERAHGDGMVVGYDSPEAFEEVLWQAYWGTKYKPDGIEMWSADEEAADFREAFVSQMQRILAVRSAAAGGRRRYLSKNNANIARIGFIRRLFPDAMIVVPFRDPLHQAGSLLKQHRRFLQQHRDDPFAKQYMGDIGHLEFGELHRPLRFAGSEDRLSRYRPESIDYWVSYWILAFEHILDHHDDLILVSYERLCQAGAAGLRELAVRLELSDAVQEEAGSELRPARSSSDITAAPEQRLLEQSAALHDRLLAVSLL